MSGAGGEPAGKTKVGIFFDLDKTLFIPNLKSCEPWIGGMLGKELWLAYLNNLKHWAEKNNIELHVGIVTMKSRFDSLVALAMRTFQEFLDLNHGSSVEDKVSSHVERRFVRFSNGVKETYLYRVWMQTIGRPRSKEKNKEEKPVSSELICRETAQHLTFLVMIGGDGEFYKVLVPEETSKVAIVSVAVKPLGQEGRVTTKSKAIKKIAADHGIPQENCILIDDDWGNLEDMEEENMSFLSAEALGALIDEHKGNLKILYDGAEQQKVLLEIQAMQMDLTRLVLGIAGISERDFDRILEFLVPPVPESVPAGGGGSAGVLASVFFRSSSDFYRREPWCFSAGALGY